MKKKENIEESITYQWKSFLLSSEEKKKAEVREKVRRCRGRAKAAKADYLTKDQPLVIDFNLRQGNAKMIVNRDISKANARSPKLAKQNELLKCTNKQLQKRLNRSNMTLGATSLSSSAPALSTESENDQPLPNSPDENLTPKRLMMRQISPT